MSENQVDTDKGEVFWTPQVQGSLKAFPDDLATAAKQSLFSVTHPNSHFPPPPPALRSNYCLHSPGHRGSPHVDAACPPPAGHSWCHTGRSDSPEAEDKVRVIHTDHQSPRPWLSGKVWPPTSSRFRSSFTQNFARSKLLLSVRSWYRAGRKQPKVGG